jgi:class 3 adenylate cyclase/HEAT repeat protein
MPAATEGAPAQGHHLTRGRLSPFRVAIAWACLALAYVSGLYWYRGRALEGWARESVVSLRASRHPELVRLFQASFYFFFDERFLPGVRHLLSPPEPAWRMAQTEIPGIERVVVLATSGSSPGEVLFDSDRFSAKPGAGPPAPLPPFPDTEVIARLGAAEPVVFVSGYRLRVLMPVPAGGDAGGRPYAILYEIGCGWLQARMLAALAFGLAFAFLARAFAGGGAGAGLSASGVLLWRRFWRLRAKFLLTIVALNVMTAGIVFFSLVALQTREQTQRIERDAELFSQFSTGQVISGFTSYFYFYYQDRFLPEIKKIVASNENLVSLRIISRRTGVVLFDSEASQSGSAPSLGEGARAELAPEVEEQLRSRDWATQRLTRSGESLLSVIQTYRNENQDALFRVEYLFGYQSLERSIQAIRRQILLDLVPALALGLLVSVLFAQLLLSPIRRLVHALRRVSEGDFETTVELDSNDELGELVSAFNSMTGELRKKQELRKYLSDSTYRQIMEAPDRPGGIRLGGSRVAATILFSDIRGFVAHCESLDAEEVTSMLNEYFSEMVEVVYKHGGEVDKFIGDALLAVFYANDEVRTIRPRDEAGGATPAATALEAVTCALEMRERLAEFNRRREAAGKNTLEIGVGITHGEIISGPIGSKDRMDFTVIGDVVNLANRIEKLSKKGRHTKIVFSNHVEEKVRGLLEYEELGAEKIRGKEEEVRVFELIGIRELGRLAEGAVTSDPSLRRRSIEVLGHSRNLEALPYLVAALDDADEGARAQAVLALGKLAPRDHPAALDALFARLRSERSDRVLSALLATVGRACTSPRILELAPFLDSANERISANAVEALGQSRLPEAVDLILPRLTSRNNRVKANAAMALFAAGHVEVIGSLKPMLMSSDPLMRSSAAFAIGELTMIAEVDRIARAWRTDPRPVKLFLAELQECVPMLVALLKDSDPMVRRQSVVALGKIKDRSAVLPMIDMIEPSTDSEELIRDIALALRSIGSHRLVRQVVNRLT